MKGTNDETETIQSLKIHFGILNFKLSLLVIFFCWLYKSWLIDDLLYWSSNTSTQLTIIAKSKSKKYTVSGNIYLAYIL